MTKMITVIARQFLFTVLPLSLSLMVACAVQEKKPAEPVSIDTGSPPNAANTVAKKPGKKAINPKTKTGADNPASKIYLGSDGRLAGTGSPDRPASEVYRIAKGIHPQALSIPGLPKDKFGLIDWHLMVEKKIITPADSLDGVKNNLPLLDLDVVIKTKGDFVNDVLFRHKPHVYWLDCKNCHTGIFVMAKGKNKMSMQGIVKGKWCGRCHGKVSFTLTDCNRCHSRPKK